MANIVLAGGGTAGHVNPLLATANAIKEEHAGCHVVAVGTDDGLETTLVPQAGVALETIERVPLPRSISLDIARLPFRMRQATAAAMSILDRHKADVVIGFGGYVSTPVYLAAKKSRIPVVVHEGNARPGLANKVGARFAATVALTFPSTPLRAKKGITVCVGLPLKREIERLAGHPGGRSARRVEAAARYGLDPDKPIMLVTGGSSGAQHLNEVFAQSATDILDAGIQVIHVTGRDKDGPVRERVSDPRYAIVDYVDDMETAYSAADLAVSRAGAGMVAELSALGIPAVFVPLPIGNGEQALNARDVVNAGGGIMIDNKKLTPDAVRDRIIPLFEGDTLEVMSARSTGVSPLNAASRLAGIALHLAEAVR
ncbi:undecaprenyldiphospho-muramoylpentapeptide beta-N-acetylglucosaminyltransferase [Trueperella bialowiezensis]|uniref:UDP-N-acetylglucosamine--N-acetylmuramyl-(pentapeptide) pyrophosphoryl-undecaprenol N-acetylglucosamine transferase n=1 Tax=Trueperella bialowiezensis TaxID=312285 RepID=A0A3S4V5M0_9ACTO|nr:undecaprenyldiphospho-muramoylpentapeptide beta-N-acetylglucosaminyltransferase [Trueperella bialowiezensis]VEI12600.1 UDP-N-acetylglucosamine--N-acetylmuramyl-(pentapeptide) pyrophosphoryl-undecaprenol N-acetylglucosamine transferase [Trueperella bialowiezensis]